jgi:hypothetical protein
VKRIDELLEAATSRFRYDAGLRQEIARELRAHLEDSIATARAEGLDEAQAEEAAVRAFGDPEEIGEKLWQANRRRLRRRAVVLAAVGMVLMPAGVLTAVWIITWTLAHSIPPYGGIICIFTIALIYLLTSKFLPKAALLDGAYLRWLAAAFGKSARVAFLNAWIWAPALAAFASDVAFLLIWQPQYLNFARPSFKLWDSSQHYLPHVGPFLVHGLPWLLLSLGYLLLAARIGKRLQSASGLSPSRARRWHRIFIVGASAGMLSTIMLALPKWAALGVWLGQFVTLLDRGFLYFYFPAYCAALPFKALVWTLFLTIVLRRLRGQALSPDGVLNSALTIIGPMVCFFFIVDGIFNAFFPLCEILLPGASLNAWVRPCYSFLHLATALLPVIIVSEQCGLRRACVRFGDFVRCHLWRYLAFIFLGALLLALPDWAPGAAFGGTVRYWSAYLGTTVTLISYAMRFALQLALTVMCFEFYLTRAGTAEPDSLEADG